MFGCCASTTATAISSIGTTFVGYILYDLFKRFTRTRASLKGHHVVITGGSSGIGKEVAFLAASKGADVTILARDLSKLEEACKEIKHHCKKDDQKINFFKTDVTNYAETEHVIQRCEVEVGPIDILVNSAGYAYPSKLEDIPQQHMKGMMDINYFGTVNAICSVLPSMKSRRRGKIVCVSSIGGLVGLFGYTGYCASKFALRGFAEALQMEVKPFNISITLSFPPDTDTPCLAEENKVKPTETKLIGDMAGVFHPSQVAKALLNDTLAGDFFSATGFDGNVSTVMCAGMSPMSSVFGLVLQVFNKIQLLKGSGIALRGFAEALQMEVKPFNISITLSFPPDTDTPCLAEENKVKPTETKLIGDMAGVFHPSQVAKALLNDTLAGDFFSATGFDGNVSTVMCAGMSPMSSVFGLVLQVLFMGVLRLVSLGYNCYFNRIVSKCASQKEKEKRVQ